MEEPPRPTIKGIFVKAHIRGLEREYGRDGVLKLHQRFRRPLNYANTDNVPIKDEVEILEHIVDIMSPHPLAQRERELEAGRLHFRNFATTPLWSLTEQIFGSRPKFLLMQSSKIAGYVFQDVEFVSEDRGETHVKITMFNNDYPIAHFEGFFEEWLRSAHCNPEIIATAYTRGRYEYDISWTENA